MYRMPLGLPQVAFRIFEGRFLENRRCYCRDCGEIVASDRQCLKHTHPFRTTENLCFYAAHSAQRSSACCKTSFVASLEIGWVAVFSQDAFHQLFHWRDRSRTMSSRD